jgi:hypothetical protein
MALKKTVKKRRRAKRKVVSMETITEALQADINLSAANKRALSRLSKAEIALERQDKVVATNSDRVEKARSAVSSAKTAASKAKAKERLNAAQDKLKQVKADRSVLVSEQSKAIRLAKGLYKAMQSAQAKMIKDFEKSAKSLEKAVDTQRRRRRRTKKKVAAVVADAAE